ncbi:hypothetical protein MTO96_010916 [Rhipicephalus appendiculatus]
MAAITTSKQLITTTPISTCMAARSTSTALTSINTSTAATFTNMPLTSTPTTTRLTPLTVIKASTWPRFISRALSAMPHLSKALLLHRSLQPRSRHQRLLLSASPVALVTNPPLHARMLP